MKGRYIAWLLALFLIVPVSAMEFTAPNAPEGAQQYMPSEPESFGEGLWYVIKSAIGALQPSLSKAAGSCLTLIATVLLISLLQVFTDTAKPVVELAAVVAVSVVLLQPVHTLIGLGAETVKEMSDYGKLLLPVMSGAMAAQGGVTSSAALYGATALFSSALSALIAKALIPMTYIFLCLCVANCATGQELLRSMANTVKWSSTWLLKTILYVFTGYMSITGVVSGSTDAAALKAAKLTISGVVPVVGGIISDASESILVSAGIMKSTAGIYGLLAVSAVCIGPFLQIGLQYLLLKASCGVCSIFGNKRISGLIKDFSGAMGLILGMTGAMCLLLLISTICFMKGVG